MSAAQIEDRAALWLLKRESEAWTDADAAQLEAWLEASPEHKVAFWRMEHGWAKAERLAALRAPVGAPAGTRRPARDRRPVWAIAAALAAVAVVFAAWRPVALQLGAGATTYATEVGAQRTVPLADGSKVELNTATTLKAQVSRTQRDVWLEGGEAYFEIAHDAAHPFVVHAGDRRITVLGTKFSVRRDGDRVRVEVVEGRVKVEPVKSQMAGTAIAAKGDVVVGQGALTVMTAKPVEAISQALSWRRGELYFERATLPEVASEFNRYNRRKLVVDASVGADVRIGGSFAADNVETFARLLRDAYGLKVADREDRIIISR